MLPDASSTAPSPAAPVNSAAASAGERLTVGLGGPSEGLQTGPTGSAVSGNPAAVNILAGTGRLGELLGVNRNGIRFGGFTITDANGNVSGGLGPGKWAGDTMTVADLSIDMETMVDWKGGLFGTQFLYYDGFGPGYTINGFEQGKNNANALTGGVMPFNSLGAQPPFSRAELFQLWYRQELFDKKLVLRIGKQVAPYAFGNVVTSVPMQGQQSGPTGISSALFTPLYQNPTTLGVMPGDYNSVCGLVASYIPNDYVYLQYGIYDGNLARGVQTGLTGPHFNGYWLHLIEGGAAWTVGSDRKPGKFGAGAWFQTGKLTGFGGEELSGANGIYMFGSQRLYYENADLNGNGLTAWSQFGATNSDIVPTHRYFGFGLTYFGPVRGRDEDSCGFGLAYGIMTNNPDAGAAYFMGDDLRSNKLGSSETILTWPQMNQTLLEPQQQVIDQGVFCSGLFGRDFTQGHKVLFAVVPEAISEAPDALLDAGEWMTPMSPQTCCQLLPRPQVILRHHRPKALLPDVGLEPTPSCEDRILSPVRLPYSWYWKHVAVMLKGFDCKAVTILLLTHVHCSRIGLILPILFPICSQNAPTALGVAFG